MSNSVDGVLVIYHRSQIHAIRRSANCQARRQEHQRLATTSLGRRRHPRHQRGEHRR